MVILILVGPSDASNMRCTGTNLIFFKVYQADLRRRTIRLENFLKLPVPTRQKFDKGLARTTTITVEGIRTDAGITGKHSTWKAGDEEEEDVSVEETALSHYRDEGWDGFHSENGVLTMIVRFSPSCRSLGLIDHLHLF